jgi:LysR family glycine cleavage system transcriptional activator
MRNIPSLRSIQAFEAAARLGSFMRASEELKVTPSAISHQVRALEKEIGAQLFHRISRAIVLTDTGRSYAAEIGEAFGQIEAATRDLTRRGKSDILTIHSVPSIAAQWLMPRITRFTALHPEFDVRLNASGEVADLGHGTVDFDLRYGAPVAMAGIAIEPLPEETIVALCAPSLVEGPNALRTPADLARHPLIHSEVNLYRWRDFARDHGVRLDLEHGSRFDRSFLAISAAMDGLGVCLESRLLVGRELASGRLVLPFGETGHKMRCHSLVHLRSRARLGKIAAFRKWIFAELAAG